MPINEQIIIPHTVGYFGRRISPIERHFKYVDMLTARSFSVLKVTMKYQVLLKLVQKSQLFSFLRKNPILTQPYAYTSLNM